MFVVLCILRAKRMSCKSSSLKIIMYSLVIKEMRYFLRHQSLAISSNKKYYAFCILIAMCQ